MGMVLLADLCEQLEIGPTVLVAILHTDLRKYAWHRFGADSTIDRAHRTEAAVALPLVIVGFCSTPCSEQSGSSEFFDTDRKAHVDLASLDRHDGGAESGGTRCACIRDVVGGDTGLTNLLL